MLYVVPICNPLACCCEPKPGTISVSVWNLISSAVGIIAFAVLASQSTEEILISADENHITLYEDATPTLLVSTAVVFGLVFLLNAGLLWATLKEVRAYLVTWMVATVMLETGILLLTMRWLPSYGIPSYFWIIRTVLSLSFLKTVFLYYDSLKRPSVVITIVQTDDWKLLGRPEPTANPV